MQAEKDVMKTMTSTTVFFFQAINVFAVILKSTQLIV